MSFLGWQGELCQPIFYLFFKVYGIKKDMPLSAFFEMAIADFLMNC